MNDWHLGEKTSYPTSYDSSLLVPISRLDSRQKSGLNENNRAFYGMDSWTAYELSWLSGEGVPRNGILYLSYSSDSKNFIESKSLKLYINSLNNHKFIDQKELIEVLQKDLSDCVKETVSIEIKKEPKSFLKNIKSIDEYNIEAIVGNDINSLVLKNRNEEVDEQISCSLFRSLCPVTAQPDWASIIISYSGLQIDYPSLLAYLISYRNHQGFHEECVERIFDDLSKRCKINSLTVQANYLRRGGIEINPLRSSMNNFEEILREKRQ